MPTTVLLIRHPESAWNRKGIYQGQRDITLSSLGRMQAELVAARLSREHLSGIVCSPLRRARMLAQAIARYQHLTPQLDERLTEIAHGSWEGLSRDEARTRFPEMYGAWTERPHDVKFPGGECLHEVHDRSLEPVVELLQKDDGGTYVVVTHDTVARLVIAAANERPVEGVSGVTLHNAGITTSMCSNHTARA